ncbi:MAG: CDP-alcohol phosphatidyltransferase family protein [Acidimicrobiia bacterium]
MADASAPVSDPANCILTIPNLITFIRLLCVPLFLWLLFGVEDRVAAAALLAILGATDWIDGYIARHFDQKSVVGTVMDPVADRVLLGTAVIALIVDGSVPFWIGVLILVREIAVAAMSLAFIAAGAKRIEVEWVGKAGAFALMFALPLFCLGDGIDTGHTLVRLAAWICAIVGLVLSYYAAIEYLPRWIRALHEGRAARHAEPAPGPARKEAAS